MKELLDFNAENGERLIDIYEPSKLLFLHPLLLALACGMHR